jgi:hypothetical protein
MNRKQYKAINKKGRRQVKEEIKIKKLQKQAYGGNKKKQGFWDSVKQGLIQGDPTEDVFNARAFGAKAVEGATMGLSNRNDTMKGMSQVANYKMGPVGSKIVEMAGETLPAMAMPGSGISGGALYGGVSGAAHSYGNRNNPKQVVKDAISGAATGAVVGGATKYGAKAVKAVTKQGRRARFARSAKKKYKITEDQAARTKQPYTSSENVNPNIYAAKKGLQATNPELQELAQQRFRDLEAADRETVSGMVNKVFKKTDQSKKRVARGLNALKEREAKAWEGLQDKGRLMGEPSEYMNYRLDETNSPLFAKLAKQARGSALTHDELQSLSHPDSADLRLAVRRIAQDTLAKHKNKQGGFQGDVRSLNNLIENLDLDLAMSLPGYGSAKNTSRDRLVTEGLLKSKNPVEYMEKYKVKPKEMRPIQKQAFNERAGDIINDKIYSTNILGAGGRSSTSAKQVFSGIHNKLFEHMDPKVVDEAKLNLKNYAKHYQDSQGLSRRTTNIDRTPDNAVDWVTGTKRGNIRKLLKKVVSGGGISPAEKYDILSDLPGLLEMADSKVKKPGSKLSRKLSSGLGKLGGSLIHRYRGGK